MRKISLIGGGQCGLLLGFALLVLLYRAFQIKDREVEDVSRAALALRDFTLRFGERPTADVLRRHRERRRPTTRYGGY